MVEATQSPAMMESDVKRILVSETFNTVDFADLREDELTMTATMMKHDTKTQPWKWGIRRPLNHYDISPIARSSSRAFHLVSNSYSQNERGRRSQYEKH